MLKHVTELQVKILALKFIKNYRYIEIAEDLNICRQAINRTIGVQYKNLIYTLENKFSIKTA
ncbi:hypothetical protein [Clostridium sp. Marseille-Q7071]